jgi:hypothetical protein
MLNDLTWRTGQIGQIGQVWRLPDDTGWRRRIEGGNVGPLSPVITDDMVTCSAALERRHRSATVSILAQVGQMAVRVLNGEVIYDRRDVLDPLHGLAPRGRARRMRASTARGGSLAG